MDINIRKEKFRKEVIAVGGATYTERLLKEFTSYWSESNRAKKPKMRWETEKTWETPRRLVTWASRTREYTVFLSESQKTIQLKKREFAISLEKYLGTYSKDILNSFYRYWGQPENKTPPERLRWEDESYWELGTRLSQWSKKNEVMANQGMRK